MGFMVEAEERKMHHKPAAQDRSGALFGFPHIELDWPGPGDAERRHGDRRARVRGRGRERVRGELQGRRRIAFVD